MRIFLVVFLVFLGIADAWGADRQISGVVYDGDKLNSSGGLVGATVSCDSSPVVGTITDLAGKFSLKCSEESEILVEFVGYEDARISVDELAKNSTELNITLKSSNSIEAVDVVATKKSSNSIEAVDVVATNKVGDTCNPCDDRYKVDNADCDNGKKGSLKEIDSKVVCVPAECVNGYGVDVKTGKCVKKKTAPAEQAPVNTAASKNTQTQKPHSEEELEELQGKVDAAKKKEQSFANRMLSGATMAATGAGGQMLASALAEQNADADAERDMAAYLATFRCNWGSNSVPGGEQNVALAGGNELISLYQEYVALANDLKIRKSALDMTAGIESEPILDGATSGLYDDVGTGITSGAYASLARALMDPSGVDAQKWTAQKEETQKQLKTGAITAGVGAVVGLAGNALINHTDKKSAEERAQKKYKDVISKLEKIQKDLDNADGTKCSDVLGRGKTGNSPDCTCDDNNEYFHPDWKCYANNVEKFNDGISVSEPKDMVLIESLKFHTDSAFKAGEGNLTRVAENVIDDIKRLVADNSSLFKSVDYKIQIIGHTDKIQLSGKSNKELSENRANAIKSKLTSGRNALKASTVTADGVGSTGCSQDNDASCRYVEVKLYVDTDSVSGFDGDFIRGLADGIQSK
ncbi:MAG: OmpA family protein [Alphaproteobacteria bacterium]|nr:OmpA family protein [Alphaproteobacteria bacterium]